MLLLKMYKYTYVGIFYSICSFWLQIIDEKLADWKEKHLTVVSRVQLLQPALGQGKEPKPVLSDLALWG